MRLYRITYLVSGIALGVAIALPSGQVGAFGLLLLLLGAALHTRFLLRAEREKADAALAAQGVAWNAAEAAEERQHRRSRTFGTRPTPPPAPKPYLSLTPTQLSAINRDRRMGGRPMMNRKGFQAAVVDSPHPAPLTTNDWLLWFLIYDAASSHYSTEQHVGTGMDIFRGNGGDFGGAGATASWTDNDTAPQVADTASVRLGAAEIAAGLAIGARESEAASPMPSPASSFSQSSDTSSPVSSDGESRSQSSQGDVYASAAAAVASVAMPDPPSASPNVDTSPMSASVDTYSAPSFDSCASASVSVDSSSSF